MGLERLVMDDPLPESAAVVDGVGPDQFRQVFRQLASGVAVITFEVGRELHGFTATSLTSVSMVPPLALFCLANRSASRRHMEPGRFVGISVLGVRQAEIARAFAESTPVGGYLDVDVLEAGNVPVIAGSVATLEAQILDTHPAGDSTICVCALSSARPSSGGEPLVYHARDYHRRQSLKGDL